VIIASTNPSFPYLFLTGENSSFLSTSNNINFLAYLKASNMYNSNLIQFGSDELSILAYL
jgi:hypothetical protein